MDEAAFMAAVAAGHDAVAADADLVCLGEMGIGNTTVAAAVAAALFDAEEGGGRAAGPASTIRVSPASARHRRGARPPRCGAR